MYVWIHTSCVFCLCFDKMPAQQNCIYADDKITLELQIFKFSFLFNNIPPEKINFKAATIVQEVRSKQLISAQSVEMKDIENEFINWNEFRCLKQQRSMEKVKQPNYICSRKQHSMGEKVFCH